MLSRLSKFITATGAAAAITTGAMIPRPASADTTSTLLTAAAAIGAIILYSNYEHKRAEANTIVGYTRNGGTVYGDGRIVMPNGQTYYPNSNGQYAINQYGYNNGYNPQNYGYAPYGYYNNVQYNNLPRYTVPGYGNGYYNNGYYNNRAAYDARRAEEARYAAQRAADQQRWQQNQARTNWQQSQNHTNWQQSQNRANWQSENHRDQHNDDQRHH
jgi:hypothetical protein